MTKDIARTSPESSVESISAIAREEAERLGGEYTTEDTDEPLGRCTSIFVKKGNRHTVIHLTWASSHHLDKASGTIGNGSLGYDYELELLVGEPPTLNGRVEPPFTWGVYPSRSPRLDNPPEAFLTADFLRRHIRERLQPN
jgi:hypothetical protein